MRLAVIGAGNIGGTIGKAWLAAGHEVHFGVSSPEKYAELVQAGGTVTTVSEAGAGATATLLAVPGGAVPQILPSIAPALDGNIVMDATNNMGGGPLNAHAAVADAAPTARYFRAFSTLGWENFAEPGFPGGQRADLFFSGPDGDSRQKVEELIEAVGLRPVWVGEVDQVETVDGVARLWFALVMGRHLPRHTAFRMLTD